MWCGVVPARALYSTVDSPPIAIILRIHIHIYINFFFPWILFSFISSANSAKPFCSAQDVALVHQRRIQADKTALRKRKYTEEMARIKHIGTQGSGLTLDPRPVSAISLETTTSLTSSIAKVGRPKKMNPTTKKKQRIYKPTGVTIITSERVFFPFWFLSLSLPLFFSHEQFFFSSFFFLLHLLLPSSSSSSSFFLFLFLFLLFLFLFLLLLCSSSSHTQPKMRI